MSTSEILSRNNELLIFVRTLRLCRYYDLFYVVIMTYYLVGTFIISFVRNLLSYPRREKEFLDIFKATAKTVIGNISKFRDF